MSSSDQEVQDIPETQETQEAQEDEFYWIDQAAQDTPETQEAQEDEFNSIDQEAQDTSETEETQEAQEDEFYSIDTILGKRVRRGVVEYLIKWEGYGENECTWEPMENLEFAMSVVLEYEEEESVKSCSADEIEIVGIEPSKTGGKITVLVKTKVADRVFKFDSKEVAECWPESYVDFLQNRIKFWKRL